MSPEDAFLEVLARETVEGSDFQLARAAAGGTNRALADELGVNIRTVQRWANYDENTGKQARNPERSGAIREMAAVERQQRALERMAEATAFNADVEVESVSRGRTEDEGSRQAYSTQPLNMRPVVALYRLDAPMADVGGALAAALAESYVLPGTMSITDISGLSLH